MVFGFIALVVVGILFLIIYNIANARKGSKTSAADSQSPDGQLAEGSTGELKSPVEEALEAPEALVNAEPGRNPDSFDPASLENAAAAGAIHLDPTPVTTAVEDLKEARKGSLDAQYRDALRRFAAEKNGSQTGMSKEQPEEGAVKSADEAYREALRAMRRKDGK